MINTGFQPRGGGGNIRRRVTFNLLVNRLFHQIKSFLKRVNKLLAFTLAEILVVIGIIGVVATLTIPNLNNSISDTEKVTRVRKIYAQLANAISKATAKYGPLKTWSVNGYSYATSKLVAERITEFLKVQKVCSSTDYSCFTKGYPKLLNGNVPQWGSNYDIGTNDIYYRVILADGTSLAFLHWGTSSIWS